MAYLEIFAVISLLLISQEDKWQISLFGNHVALQCE